jgi:molybdopterin synthase catalytic subunit
MARSELERVAQLARARDGVSNVAIVHRTGRLEIGEISVAVAVAAPHRAEAFEVCRFVIDKLKRTVPIWKKEVFRGGEVWIEGAGETPRGDQS